MFFKCYPKVAMCLSFLCIVTDCSPSAARCATATATRCLRRPRACFEADASHPAGHAIAAAGAGFATTDGDGAAQHSDAQQSSRTAACFGQPD